jgi:hypothetical protein
MREREIRVVKIYCEANCASHELAKLGRVHGTTRKWLRESPQEIAEVLSHDCNSFIFN